ncbi:MAG: murein hydrolase activator EnvC family protein [Caldisericaceae bacterium]
MKKVILIFLVITSIFLTCFMPRAFSGLTEEQKKLDDYKKQLDQVKKNLVSIDSSSKEIKSLVDNLSSEITVVNSDIAQTEQSIAALKLDITVKESLIKSKEADIAQEESEIEDVINLSYKLSSTTPMEILFEGNDPNSVALKISYISYISSYTKNLMDKAIIDKNNLVQQKAALQKNQASLEAFLKEKEQESQVLSEEVDMKNNLLKSLQEKKTYLLYQKSEIEKEIEAENKKIAQLIEEAKKGNAILTTGLIWPVKGPITDVFGWRINPLWGGREFHEGIDIGVATGTPVHAAASGVVTYAGWMTGYGNMVMIYHGSDVTTLYAHLKSFAIKKGDSVSQGQTIAYSDNTGWSTGPHLHFGVYVGDKAVDPLKYLP